MCKKIIEELNNDVKNETKRCLGKIAIRLCDRLECEFCPVSSYKDEQTDEKSDKKSCHEKLVEWMYEDFKR